MSKLISALAASRAKDTAGARRRYVDAVRTAAANPEAVADPKEIAALSEALDVLGLGVGDMHKDVERLREHARLSAIATEQPARELENDLAAAAAEDLQAEYRRLQAEHQRRHAAAQTALAEADNRMRDARAAVDAVAVLQGQLGELVEQPWTPTETRHVPVEKAVAECGRCRTFEIRMPKNPDFDGNRRGLKFSHGVARTTDPAAAEFCERCGYDVAEVAHGKAGADKGGARWFEMSPLSGGIKDVPGVQFIRGVGWTQDPNAAAQCRQLGWSVREVDELPDYAASIRVTTTEPIAGPAEPPAEPAAGTPGEPPPAGAAAEIAAGTGERSTADRSERLRQRRQ
jgi:hypothetical protein